MKTLTTTSAKETQSLAREFAKTLSGGDIVLLEGDLGSGKTTFCQGILETLGAQKPYTSPTFVIIKTYDLRPTTHDKIQGARCKAQDTRYKAQDARRKMQDTRYEIQVPRYEIQVVHHIDTYRIESKDLISLGWQDLIADPNALILLEWPERVRDILPAYAKTVRFAHKNGDTREITLPE